MDLNGWSRVLASLITLGAASAHCAPGEAEDSVLGMYTGSMSRLTSTGPRSTAMELVILELDGGLVKATAKRYTKDVNCSGKYAMEGEFQDNVLTLRPKSGEGPPGCAVDLTMTRDGKILTGNGGGETIKLSK